MTHAASDPTGRFSERAEHYVRHRPGYPTSVLEYLRDEVGLRPAHVVADVGSGTGIFAQLLLDNGNVVHAVEPNGPMRLAAERRLDDRPNFRSIAGRAEATGLPERSVDLITCAQAFHWFELSAVGVEFRRISTKEGAVAIVWNVRRLAGAPFEADYEALLWEFGTDYQRVRHDPAEQEKRIAALFAPAGYQQTCFENFQVLDAEGLSGRILSSSYAPPMGHSRHAELLDAIADLFRRHQSNQTVTLHYDTQLYWGRFG